MTTWKTNRTRLQIGEIFQTKYYGNIEVVEDIDSRNVTILFINTGTIVTGVQRGNIRKGQVKDPSQRSKTNDHRIKLGENTYNSYLKLLDTRKGWAKYLCTLCGCESNVSKKYSEYNIPLSCGCISSLQPREDLTGKIIRGCRFIGYKEKSLWLVEYPCGCKHFRTKHSVVSRINDECNNCIIRVSPKLRHNLTGTTTHNSWLNMKRRCYEESHNRFQSYGEKGIKVCDEWLDSFENFLTDMGECPKGYSLERLDINKDYTNENCVWANSTTQANNKSNNILISNGEEVMSLKYWCDFNGIDYKSSHYKFRYKGIDVQEILGKGYRLAKNKFDI